MKALAEGKEIVEKVFLGIGRQFFGLFRSTLREIFDESAYARFLEGRGLTSSREAYGEFLREGQAARERRARCC